MEPLSSLLRCPACHGELAWTDDQARCENSHSYAIDDGIAVLLPAESYTAYKEQQAEEHDHKRPEWEEWEVVRPLTGPRFHGWLMAEKFRRSIQGIEDLVPGSTAVTTCSGSGMDAEMLARLGARVIATEISRGSVRRIAERARRTGLPILPVVADAERLPLEDQSVDIAFVHDGLHHLEDPYGGIAEMCRVARRGVSISEPAAAAATKAAVRVGAAEQVEKSGNVVGRLDQARTVEVLAKHGFKSTSPHRYGMYYRHIPGTVTQVLSRRRLYPAGTAAFLAVNRLGGGAGNKLAVQARR